MFYYNKVLALDANHAETLTNMGSIAFTKHDFRKAYGYYERAMGLDETNTVAREQVQKIRAILSSQSQQQQQPPVRN